MSDKPHFDYIRVVPRDLFNEGNLLKCYGRVYILLEGIENACSKKVSLEQDEEGAPFDIIQDENSGETCILNLPLTINEQRYGLWRPMNSRDAWPLYLRDEANSIEISVFDDKGDFTPEMLAFLGFKS